MTATITQIVLGLVRRLGPTTNLLLLLAVLCFGVGCVTTPPVASPRVISDLVYAQRGSRALKLDLYLPPNAAGQPAPRPLPVIVWVHGGGWKHGDKVPCPIRFFALEGYAVASIQYRLAGHAHFPSPVADIRQALRWLRQHQAEYGLDGRRVGLMGESAGAHLVNLVALAPQRTDWNEPVDPTSVPRVQAVCVLCGPTDLGPLVGGAVRASRNPWVGALLGRVAALDERNVEAASPLRYVSSSAPPYLIMHGAKDWFVPPLQSEHLADALFEAQVPVTYLLVPDRGHMLRPADYERPVRDFFRGWLQSKK